MKTVAFLILFLFFSPLLDSGTFLDANPEKGSSQINKYQSVGFQELSDNYRGQWIEIRGFIYASEGGTAVLAPQPNLKSCCIGHGDRAHEQILLKDLRSPLPSAQAISVRGIFDVDPITGVKSLTEAQLIPNQGKWRVILIGLGAMIAIFAVFIRVLQKAL